MKKFLTLAAIVIFSVSFANASTLNGGTIVKIKIITKTAHAKFVKFSSKDFSVKRMQDTKDILLEVSPAA